MRLSDEEIEAELGALAGWTRSGDGKSIAKRFEFADFAAAFSFMTRVALEAEKADHHPDWSNSWNRVDVALSTHSKGGVTSKDLALARAMDAAAAPLAAAARRD